MYRDRKFKILKICLAVVAVVSVILAILVLSSKNKPEEITGQDISGNNPQMIDLGQTPVGPDGNPLPDDEGGLGDLEVGELVTPRDPNAPSDDPFVQMIDWSSGEITQQDYEALKGVAAKLYEKKLRKEAGTEDITVEASITTGEDLQSFEPAILYYVDDAGVLHLNLHLIIKQGSEEKEELLSIPVRYNLNVVELAE